MEILIFENEFVYLETAFNYVNDLFFENKLNFKVHAKSQDVKPFVLVLDYDIIIVDISLSVKSILDGYGILKRLEELKFPNENIIVMTGNHKIKESLNEKQLNCDYDIITKPIDINILKSILKTKKREN